MDDAAPSAVGSKRCQFENGLHAFEGASPPARSSAVVGVEFQACAIWKRFGLCCALQDCLTVRISKKSEYHRAGCGGFRSVHPMGSIYFQRHRGGPFQLRDPFRQHGFQVSNGIVFLSTHRKVDKLDVVSTPSVFQFIRL